MSHRHLVRLATEARWADPGALAPGSDGLRRSPVVDASTGAVHTGFGVCELPPGGQVPAHVHSFEECLYVISGSLVVQTAEGAFRLGAGDYGLIPLGLAHSFRNDGGELAQWADLHAPVPRGDYGHDTLAVPALPETDPAAVDVRDPRNRSYGHVSVSNMDPDKQTQDMLAVSASMRTALLVYSGISVKMMIDSDLGAELSTMFMVSYVPEGFAGQHDHPFEETYLILDGEVEATLDGERYRLGPGDAAWAGVGCVHAFRNVGSTRVRWLETQAPQPPRRHSYRFARDWEYLRSTLDHPQ